MGRKIKINDGVVRGALRTKIYGVEDGVSRRLQIWGRRWGSVLSHLWGKTWGVVAFKNMG